MKIAGYALLVVGFLAGALAAVWDPASIQWAYFAAAVTAGIVGIVLIRTSHSKTHRSEEKLTANMQIIRDSMTRIVENINTLNAEKGSINTYDVRHRIDELFLDDINAFIDARHSITHVYSLQVYADIMSDFAAAERYLNRTWSASADGYIDEVNAYIEKTAKQFAAALEKINKL